MNSNSVFDWIFVYWLPYDNDLSIYAEEIIQMLADGTRGSSNILVTVQADIHGHENHSRHIISNGNVSSESLSVTNSADEQVMAEFLKWNSSQFQSRNWIMAILDHGGRLDQISPDLNTGLGGNNAIRWMKISRLKDVFDQFQQEIGQPIELLFLQNCFKGTLETHYTLRKAARFTLSSPVLVGAPNRYYVDALQYASASPSVNGLSLAQSIMSAEHDRMFHIYTVSNNQALALLPAQLDPIIEDFLASGSSDIRWDKLDRFEYAGENYVDVLEFLQLIAARPIDSFKVYWFSALIGATMYSPRSEYPGSSGLTMWLPRAIDALEQHSYLPIYQDTKLASLFRTILSES